MAAWIGVDYVGVRLSARGHSGVCRTTRGCVEYRGMPGVLWIAGSTSDYMEYVEYSREADSDVKALSEMML